MGLALQLLHSVSTAQSGIVACRQVATSVKALNLRRSLPSGQEIKPIMEKVMSNTEVRIIEVDVEAIGRRLYVGNGIKPGGEVVLNCESGSDVIFLGKRVGEHRDKDDRRKIPFKVSGERVRRNSKIRPKGGAVEGVVSEFVDWGEERRFPFMVESSGAEQQPTSDEYRLAFSEEGDVHKIILNLGPIQSHDIYYKIPRGVPCTFRFSSRIPWFAGNLLEIAGPENPDPIAPKVLKEFSVTLDDNATEAKKIATLRWPFHGPVELPDLPVKPLILESGGTESVDIYVDPDDG